MFLLYKHVRLTSGFLINRWWWWWWWWSMFTIHANPSDYVKKLHFWLLFSCSYCNWMFSTLVSTILSLFFDTLDFPF